MIYSRIYSGYVSHQRRLPVAHGFRYRIFMMYLDLDELAEVFTGNPLWSASKPAIAWFRRTDHLGPPGIPLKEAVANLVEERTGIRPQGRIRLLTHLRYLGYCMNPVSFYYCWNSEESQVDFIVAEVNNTPWGERHCYVMDCQERTEKMMNFNFGKQFHVSPFMGMDQEYSWSFVAPRDSLKVNMDNFENGEHIFRARLILNSMPITVWNLYLVLFQYPFMTARVITAIYWQAFRLWMKKTPFHDHPVSGIGNQEYPKS